MRHHAKVKGSRVIGLKPEARQENYAHTDDERGFFVIADGFGGPRAGAAATRIGCEALADYLKSSAGDLDATMPFVLRSYYSLIGNVLFNALVHANGKMRAFNEGRKIHDRGGASVLALAFDDSRVALAGVGVCGATLVREGRAAPLVQPKSLGRMISPFSDMGVSGVHVPMVSLGTSADLEPEIVEYQIQAGDWLLLHTMDPDVFWTQAVASLQVLSDEASVEQIFEELEGVSDQNQYNQLKTLIIL